MIHLRAVTRSGNREDPAFPFSVPAIRTLEVIAFESPVTFLVGENGSGKSTLLEVLAIATNLPAVAGSAVRDDATLIAQRKLASALGLSWTARTHRASSCGPRTFSDSPARCRGRERR